MTTDNTPFATRIEDIDTAAIRETVCTVGMFDGVHRGHQLILQRLSAVARERGREAVVVTFDQHPRIVLGHYDGSFRLLSTNAERFEAMRRCGAGNIVVVGFTPEVAKLSARDFFDIYLSRRLKAKTLLVGHDNMFGNKRAGGFDQLFSLPGIECLRTEALADEGVEISSTQIRRALQQGDVERANRMLGYRYSISGRVVHGQALGRTMGFPTANLQPFDPMKAMPGEGVYAAEVTVDGKTYLGMANWGPRPTIGANSPELEIHLLDYHGNLYGMAATVAFVLRLRDIQTFNSLNELSRQLETDRQTVLETMKAATPRPRPSDHRQ